MIDLICRCGQSTAVEESDLGKAVLCPSCQGVTTPIAAETLEPGAGAGDFDAVLSVQEGPACKGECMAIGGVAEIEIGKQARHLKLPGNRLSRLHCFLRRLDFGPSRWQIVDNNSTHGLHVNGKRVKEVELRPGDRIQLGEYVLSYHVNAPEPAPAMATAAVSASAASLPPIPKTPALRPATTKPAKQEGASDGWNAEETQANKVGLYVVMVPSILAALLASGFVPIEVPVGILCAVVGVCGIVGGIINILGRGPLWAGALIGLIMGLGGFGAVAWWIHGREYVRKYEMVIAFVVGAAPGFGVQFVLQRVLGAKGD